MTHRTRARYTDGTPVSEGDRIRYRQAPGGLVPRSSAWRYGYAEKLARPYSDSPNELYLHCIDYRWYYLVGHEIERVSDSEV